MSRRLIFVLSTLLSMMACDSPRATSETLYFADAKQTGVFSPVSTPPIQRPEDEEVVNQVDGESEPSIFHFLKKSDFVVLARLIDRVPIAKRERKVESDLADLVAGRGYKFEVERHLCTTIVRNVSAVENLDSLNIFVLGQTSGEHYSKGERYLFFIQKEPNLEDLSIAYDLQKNLPYYRVVDGGSISLFPSSGGMHPPSTKGFLKLSDLIERSIGDSVETLCSAVDTSDSTARSQKLKILIDSDDEVLRDNALYLRRALKAFKR
jgi:hypothetical protein